VGTAPPDRHHPVAWVVVLIGAVGFVASVSDLVDHYRDPEVPTPVTLQDVLDGKVGPKAYVEVTDYRLCENYVKSWDRGGRVLDDRLWCTGLVAGVTTRGPSDCTRPRVIYKPHDTHAAEPFLEQFQKQGVLRGRLSKDVGLSALEKDRIAKTYPHLDRSCLALYEDPPPRTLSEIRGGFVFGGVMTVLGFAFTDPGRRLRSWIKQHVVKWKGA
jgi:hypothetical protein